MSLSRSPALSCDDLLEHEDRLICSQIRSLLEQKGYKSSHVGGGAAVAVEVAFLWTSRDGTGIGVGAKGNGVVSYVPIFVPGAGVVSGDADNAWKRGR
jgi:hypothetical protein